MRWRSSNGEKIENQIISETNSYLTIDYSPDGGTKFVCAGKNPTIEVYDEETLQMMSEFKSSHKHSNKIFCTKFNNQDPNVIYSGGWDR
jgi:WD40 repeat protein